MDWGFYGCRNWTQFDAFLAKPSAVCVWFKRCPLIGCSPELVRSMPAPTQRQLLADGFMKQRCIIIIRALLLMPSLNGCFAVRGYLFSKFDWFQSVVLVWERKWSGALLPTWLPHMTIISADVSSVISGQRCSWTLCSQLNEAKACSVSAPLLPIKPICPTPSKCPPPPAALNSTQPEHFGAVFLSGGAGFSPEFCSAVIILLMAPWLDDLKLLNPPKNH